MAGGGGVAWRNNGEKQTMSAYGGSSEKSAKNGNGEKAAQKSNNGEKTMANQLAAASSGMQAHQHGNENGESGSVMAA